jgi:hypothetical protein
VIAESCNYIEKIFPEISEKYPSLIAIRHLFENLEEIKAYYSQETAIKGPFLPPIGKINF